MDVSLNEVSAASYADTQETHGDDKHVRNMYHGEIGKGPVTVAQKKVGKKVKPYANKKSSNKKSSNKKVLLQLPNISIRHSIRITVPNNLVTM